MKRLWLAKIFIALGVLAFVVRPFYGFAMVARHHQPVANNILVKIFSKRGPEFQDDAVFGMSDFDKKSPHPGFKLLPYTGGLPDHIFAPCNIAERAKITFLKERKLNLFSPAPAWLLNSQLII